MSSKPMPAPSTAVQRLGQSLALTGLGVLGAFLALWVSLALLLIVLVVGVWLFPGAWSAIRKYADTHRRLALQWSGVDVARGYASESRPGTIVARWSWVRSSLGDDATWRDVLWLVANPFVGTAIACVPLAAVLSGVWGLLLLGLWGPVVSTWDSSWYLFVPLNGGLTVVVSAVLGLGQIFLAFWLAGPCTRAHARWTQRILGRPSTVTLQQRIGHLSRSRDHVIDHEDSQVRRIERDLHDGAQARLVAMGMTLTAAERLLTVHPEAARALLLEAKDSSAQALQEIRDLVRGIHPPVLADRGLFDAVKSLALSSPLSVQVQGQLAGRPPKPLEAAVYFAVSELLTNAAKHAHATSLTVQVAHSEGVLRVSVNDDGVGGIVASKGSGLDGIEERLAAFDGSLIVLSPIGGPTTVVIEVPCALAVDMTDARK